MDRVDILADKLARLKTAHKESDGGLGILPTFGDDDFPPLSSPNSKEPKEPKEPKTTKALSKMPNEEATPIFEPEDITDDFYPVHSSMGSGPFAEVCQATGPELTVEVIRDIIKTFEDDTFVEPKFDTASKPGLALCSWKLVEQYAALYVGKANGPRVNCPTIPSQFERVANRK